LDTPGPSSLPQSPAFGDFGGFSGGFGSDMNLDFGSPPVNPSFTVGGFEDTTEDVDDNNVDPWGNGAAGSWGEVEDQLPKSLDAPVLDEDDDDDEGDGWGGGRSTVPVADKARGDVDWEEAQRKIRLKQERAVRPP
jgi:hypothetical protein